MLPGATRRSERLDGVVVQPDFTIKRGTPEAVVGAKANHAQRTVGRNPVTDFQYPITAPDGSRSPANEDTANVQTAIPDHASAQASGKPSMSRMKANASSRGEAVSWR